MQLDPRIHAFKPELADIALKGVVEAKNFIKPSPLYVEAGSAFLYKEPDKKAKIVSELLLGEEIHCFESNKDWVWVQAKADHFVGYSERGVFSKKPPDFSFQEAYITAPFAWIYAEADIKSSPVKAAGMNSRVWLNGKEKKQFLQLNDGYWIAKINLKQQEQRHFSAIAGDFLHTPYLLGGRSWRGIDCSGLVQMALWAVGFKAPRDTDMQENMPNAMSVVFDEKDQGSFHNGDLIFWPGHVGIWLESGKLLHASAYHSRVVIEDFKTTLKRFEQDTLPEISKVLRLSFP